MKVLLIVFALITFNVKAQFISPSWEGTWFGGASFSSVRATDLNDDGVEDIVVGAGIEDAPSNLGVIAIDGLTGDTLWTRGSRNQIYTSVIFGTSADSSTTLVYIAGRDAQLLCLDGSNGNSIWEFWSDDAGSARAAGWLNFYNPRFIGRQNENLLVTNGGLAIAAGNDPNRPPGKLLILDRFDGSILNVDTIPDGSETYFSPMQWPLSENIGGDLIVIGSGGETLAGSVWTLSLEEFEQDGLRVADRILQSSEKGFIQAPAFADLNSDGEYDMIVPRMNKGGLIALDGLTKEIIWSFELPGTENYVSPIVGDFSGDGLPDVFGILAQGIFPFYTGYEAHLIDGQSGLSLFSDSFQVNQFSAGNALDWDNDGVDELLMIENKFTGSRGISHAFKILDFNNDTSYFITEFKSGSVTFSTPLIRDIDQDGLLEIIYVFDPGSSASGEIAKTSLARFDLTLTPESVAWGGFMGNFEDGTYRENLNDTLQSESTYSLNIFPNPTTNQLRIIDPAASLELIRMISQSGKVGDIGIEKFGRNYLIDTSRLANGLFILKVIDGDRIYTEKILIEK